MKRAASRFRPLLALAALAVSAGAPASLSCTGTDCDCGPDVLDLTVIDATTSQPVTQVKFNDGPQQLTGVPAECDDPSEPCDQWVVYPSRISGVHQLSVSAAGYATQMIDITVGTGLDGCACVIVTAGQNQTVALTPG